MILKEENTTLDEQEIHAIQDTFRHQIKKRWLFILVISVSLVFFIFISLTLGSTQIPLSEIFQALFQANSGATDSVSTIILRIRLPRVLSAALAGMTLSICGVAMQNILRNPLGSPFTLGLSNAAAFGAGLAIMLFGAGSMQSTYSDAVIINNPYIVTLSAFTFCVLATVVLLLISKVYDARPQTMILMGIILGSLFSASSTALQYFADEVQLAALVYWTFGDLGRANWTEFWIIAVVALFGAVYFFRNAWNYNALDSGDDVAQSLGVNIDKTRMRGMMVASLLTATVISFFGIIAYVGLVVPHMVRKILGNDERVLIIASSIFGALFLLIADTIARTILSPVVLPVGVLTSFLGAPLFLYILFHKKK